MILPLILMTLTHRGAPNALWTRSDDDDRGGLQLTYLAGSSKKVEQIDGDFDYSDARDYAHPVMIVPTVSKTVTQCDVAGNDLGSSFEHNGKLMFLFGDTISSNPTAVNYHAGDPIAWSTSRDPEDGLFIHYLTQKADSTKPLFIMLAGIPMGADDTPNAGISLNGQIYIICNAGTTQDSTHSRLGEFSELVTFNETTQIFTPIRTVSTLHADRSITDPSQGHFVYDSLHEFGDYVLMYGSGERGASDIYLAAIPKRTFASGEGTIYFTGNRHGWPTWSTHEADSVPVVQDNPQNGPPWPHDNPTVSDKTVVYSEELGLWLMTFDGGHQHDANTDLTKGVYFSYASQPWGPWSKPQLIFNPTIDNALGAYMSNFNPMFPNTRGVPAGPTIGDNDPYHTTGAAYCPAMIERFTRVNWTRRGPVLSIYYLMSTWNPYTPVLMRTDLTISDRW